MSGVPRQPVSDLYMHATERGCTRPGCDVPASWCQTHHVRDWAKGGPTNINNLTLACGPDNRLATDDGWTTRKRPDGTTEWIPPPDQDRGQRRTNTYFHPENMLPDEDP
jgi:HNH endonuclease